MARTNPLPRRLTLEAAQGGLSWKTILHKRDGYRSAFQKFDPARVAHFNTSEVEALLSDPGIVRNRPKLQSTMNNARRILEVQREFGTFDAYIWRFVARTWSMAAGKGCSGARRYSGNSTRIPLAIELGRGNRRLPVSLPEPVHHVVVGEPEHPAVGVVDHHYLFGAQQPGREDKGPDPVVIDHSAEVPDHVGIGICIGICKMLVSRGSAQVTMAIRGAGGPRGRSRSRFMPGTVIRLIF